MMNNAVAGRIDFSAILDMYTYLDDAVVGHNYENRKLSDIVEDLYARAQAGDTSISADNKQCINVMRQSLQQHNDWGEAVLKNTSSYDAYNQNTVEWTDDSIQAATFQLGDDYYMSFRGTGNGRWTDDGVGMTELSPMQDAAIKYYEQMVDELHLDQSSGNLYVGGHSKGGNEAQVIMLHSDKANLIDGVYSIDGQGLPYDEAYYRRILGDAEYERRLAKMYSICGEYDPVHELGHVLISEDNTYYLPVSGDGLLPWHDMKYMLMDNNGNYTGIQWDIDENGNYLHGEPQYPVLFARNLNKWLMSLDPDKRDSISRTVMFIIDVCTKKYLTDPKYIPDLHDWLDFIFIGLPKIGSELLFTPEGNQILMTLLVKTMTDWLGDKWGVLASAVILTIATLILAKLAFFGEIYKILDSIYETFKNIISKIADLAKDVFDTVKSIFDMCKNALGSFISHLVNGYAYKYVDNNPCISIDPDKLEAFAQKLDSLNRRLENVESRIKSLYSEVDLLDKSWVQGADMKIGSSSKLRKSKEYLEYAASEFRNAERNIRNQLSEVF